MSHLICRPLRYLTPDEEKYFSAQREAAEATDISGYFDEFEVDVEPIEEYQPMQSSSRSSFDSKSPAPTVTDSSTPEPSIWSSALNSSVSRGSPFPEGQASHMRIPRRPTLSRNGPYVPSSLAYAAHTTSSPTAPHSPYVEYFGTLNEGLAGPSTETDTWASFGLSPGGEFLVPAPTNPQSNRYQPSIPVSSPFKLVLPEPEPAFVPSQSKRRRVTPPQSTSWLRSQPSAHAEPISENSTQSSSHQSAIESSLVAELDAYGRLDRASTRIWCDLIIRDMLELHSSPAIGALPVETFQFIDSLGAGSGPLAPSEREQLMAITRGWDIIFADGSSGRDNQLSHSLEQPGVFLN